jgi:hypothetical protein
MLERQGFLVTDDFFVNRTNSNTTTEPPIWLYVRSMSIEATVGHAVQPGSYGTSDLFEGQSSSQLNCASDRKKKPSFHEPIQPKRRRMVRFAAANGEDEEIKYAAKQQTLYPQLLRGWPPPIRQRK